MKIAFVTSEVVPFSKTGGLADVSGALPVALKEIGHDVMVITPKYKAVKADGLSKLPQSFKVNLGGTRHEATLFESELPGGVKTLFIGNGHFFDRDGLYSTPDGDHWDNFLRFGFFSHAALKAVMELDFAPDVIHLNDWQSALIPVFIKRSEDFRDAFHNVKTLITVHNLGYHGLFDKGVLKEVGLDESLFSPKFMEFYGKVNFLKGGLIFADAINTVSPTYSHEIQSSEFGHGLEGVLRERSERLFGILNGIDAETWNPATDKFIEKNFTFEDLSGKAECKEALQKEMSLPINPNVPLVAMISRLADQKGFDILEDVIKDVMIRDLQLVILGTGDKKYHLFFENIAPKYSRKLHVRLAFDNALAHQIEAGADMFLMPSRYEPCGLNQMMSLRYGTVPVVRETGGLADTIREFSGQDGNGFKFRDYNGHAMVAAIDRALKYYHDPLAWTRVIENGMKQDFSWGASAKKYEELYNRLER